MGWIYKNKKISSIEDVPPSSIGFIYNITDLETGKQYIGRKSFYSTRNVIVSKAVYDKAKAAGEKVTKTKDKKKSRKKYA